MGDRDVAEVEVVVGEHRTADGRDELGILLNTVVLHRFSDKFVQYTVAAAGAVVHILFDRAGTAVESIKKDRRTKVLRSLILT